eukprot:scaffold40052_cov18-Prasinocladus_malaysianus.AAC.2
MAHAQSVSPECFPCCVHSCRKIARELLEICPTLDVAAVDGSQRTPLHVAAEKGFERMVGFLLQAVPKESRDDFCRMQDSLGYTGLHYAAQGGFLRILELLIDESTDSVNLVNVVSLDGHSALSLAVKGGYTKEFAVKLLEAGAEQGDGQGGHTALHWACKGGHADTAQMLTDADMPPSQRRANVNAKDPDGNTPLILAVQSSAGANLNVVQHLLDAGADINFPIAGSQGTVLHWACEHGQEAIVMLLVKNKAACNALNGDGETPFMVGVTPQDRHLDAMRALQAYLAYQITNYQSL